MEWDYSGNFLSRAWTIPAAGDKWADRGGRLFFFPFTAQPQEELRAASGRAGAAIGASRASRTPECGTLCCRRRGMAALLHVGRSSFSSSFLTREELRVRTIHAAGDKWADRGRSALPF